MSTAMREQIPALDGLRAFACLLVVVSHIPKYMSGATDLFRFPIHLGEPGVALFFVLSGFLMAYLYINRVASKENFLSYAIARFSRIAPAYWIAIMASYVIHTHIDPAFPFDMSMLNLIRHILFVGSVGVFWSIPPEVQYYIYFMLVWAAWYVYFIQGKKLWLTLMLILSVMLMLSRASWPGILLPSKLHFFVAGSLAGVAYLKMANVSLSSKTIMMVQMLVMILFAISFFQLAGLNSSYFYNSSLFYVFSAGLVFCCAYTNRFVKILFGGFVLRWIGKVSFSVYLFHDFVIYYMNLLSVNFHLSGYLFDLFVLVFSILIPSIFSVYVELPLCRWVKCWLHRFFDTYKKRHRAMIVE